jgi:hypothetical protein
MITDKSAFLKGVTNLFQDSKVSDMKKSMAPRLTNNDARGTHSMFGLTNVNNAENTIIEMTNV